MRKLGKCLESNTFLQELNVSCHDIDDEGVKELAKSLVSNTTLQELNMWSNQYTDLCNNHATHYLVKIILEFNATLKLSCKDKKIQKLINHCSRGMKKNIFTVYNDSKKNIQISPIHDLSNIFSKKCEDTNEYRPWFDFLKIEVGQKLEINFHGSKHFMIHLLDNSGSEVHREQLEVPPDHVATNKQKLSSFVSQANWDADTNISNTNIEK